MSADYEPVTISKDTEIVLEKLISRVVKDVVRGELSKHQCRFNISKEDAKHAGHFIGMVKDLGGGNLSKGTERMRDNNKVMAWQRKQADRIGAVVFNVLIVSAVGGVITLIVLGFKDYIKKKVGM